MADPLSDPDGIRADTFTGTAVLAVGRCLFRPKGGVGFSGPGPFFIIFPVGETTKNFRRWNLPGATSLAKAAHVAIIPAVLGDIAEQVQALFRLEG